MTTTPDTNKTENPFAAIAAFARELIDGARDRNNVMATGKVEFCFRDHYVNPSDGTMGIQELIRKTLLDAGAVFPNGAENTSMRSIVISKALVMNALESKIRAEFGADRYPMATLRTMLTDRMQDVVSVQLTKAEDPTGKKPRTCYYIVQ